MVRGLNFRGGALLLSDDSMLLLRAEGSGCAKAQGDLYDYKLFRFSNGQIITLAMTDRFTGGALSKTFFDDEWNAMAITEGNHPTHPELSKPRFFNQMKEMANLLGAGLPFVRVDFYESGGRLYFGELTFYPNSGFEHFNPSDTDYVFGQWIDLEKAVEGNHL